MALLHIMKYLFLLISLFPITSFSSDLHQKAYEREWLVLMHYKKVLLGYKSEVDGDKFFISPKGKRDPETELTANLEMFQQEHPAGDLHPQCVFPARFRYLKKNFNLKAQEVDCQQYSWWRQNLPYKSVTVIFASYYANNPASIYGHSFLRINSSDTKNISDYGLDFSAITTTDHGVEFAVRGLLGGYTGLFSLKPYYLKLNDYIENESRDLWEYDLSLTPEQIDYMLAHLWELMRYGQFDYYFLDENCSYQILTLLEVADPSLHLSDDFFFKTIPIDTIKEVMKSGTVKAVHYRLSYKKNVMMKLNSLSSPERKRTDEILEFKTKPETETSPKVLEASAASLRYERFEQKALTEDQKNLLRDIQLSRARIGGVTETQAEPTAAEIKSIRPDLSHHSEKYTFAVGYNTLLNTYTEITARASLNDLIELDRGYPYHSLIETSHLKLRYVPEKQRLFFQELKYAEAFSLFPLDGHEFKWSWRAGLRSYRVYDQTCKDCVSHQLKSGGGLAKDLGQSKMTVYSLILANGEVSKGFYRGYRLSPALDSGLVWTLRENIKLNYDFEVNHDLNRQSSVREFRLTHQFAIAWNYHTQQEWRLSATSWDSVKNEVPVEEIQFSYGFYY